MAFSFEIFYNIYEVKTMKDFVRFLKFTLFSISAGLIEIGTFTLLNEVFHLPYWVCYLTGLVLSVVWNFTLNRKFTFQSAANVPKAMFKVFLFYLVFTPASTYLEHLLTTTLGWNEYLVTGINMVLNFTLEFFYQRYYVFKASIDTAVREK
jgi:putative flippase GtrA